MTRLPALAAAALLAASGEALAQPTDFAFDIGQFPFVLEDATPRITGPVDPRFFGTYCQTSPREFCKSVPIFPDPCVTLRDMRVALDHLTSPTGGLLVGGGRFVLDGEQGAIGIAGSVTRRGRARFSTSIPGLAKVTGADLRLSGDGLVLTASVQNKSISLRKDACGNAAPAVVLTAPSGPSTPFGQTVMLAGSISDEDTSFPEQRLVFTSDRQGLLSGTRVAGGRTLFVSNLVPGPHHLTLTVTDSGGLTGQASLDITILNRPPDPPRIFLPAEGATLVAEAPVLLQGHALDPDTGFLPGSALVWSVQLAPGGAFEPLGPGNELGTIFAVPADPVRIRLTARDNTGLTSQTERQVRVIANTGNAPPVVVIQVPDRLTVDGSPVAGFFAPQPAHFLARAFDVEDPVSELELTWELVAIDGPGGAPIPSPPVPNPAPVTGTLAPEVLFSPGTSSLYRVTFRATDRGGLTSSDSIEIFVIPNVIL